MNALVAFRGNSVGNLTPTRVQRQEAQENISAMLKARVEGASQLSAAKSLPGKAGNSITPDNELGKDAFLQLLVLQMQNQDPLEPLDNSEMIAQLAQFTSLEQMTQLNESFTDLTTSFQMLTGNVDQLNFMTAQGLLGKYVEGISIDGELHSGQVESVHLDGSIVVLTVDGKFVPMTGVLSVTSDAPEPSEPPDSGGEQE